jgi:hypothetical protein
METKENWTGMYSGGLLITVAQDKWPLSENEKRRIDDAVEAINGSRLPLTYGQGGTVVDLIALWRRSVIAWCRSKGAATRRVRDARDPL